MRSDHSKRPTGKRGCVGHTKAGDLCDGPAVDGTSNCRMHPGKPLAQLKAEGAVVTTIRRWHLDDLPENPGVLLLKLMTVTEWNRLGYEAEIDRIIAESGTGNLTDALVADAIVVDKNGSPQVVGEYVRGIVQLEAAERKLAAELAIKALAANVQERLTRLQEAQAELVVDVIGAVLGDLGHQLTDPLVQRVLSERLAPLSIAGAVA